LFDGIDDKEYFLEPTLEFRRKISDSKKNFKSLRGQSEFSSKSEFIIIKGNNKRNEKPL
jgi:hypothetical protein